jgi:hypothetical protein
MSAPKSVVIGDAEYLKAMSGYKQKTSVARWCRKNKIQFFLDARGWPVTTRDALNLALSPGIESGPDWSAFKPDPNSTHWRHKRRCEQEAAKPLPQPRKKRLPK